MTPTQRSDKAAIRDWMDRYVANINAGDFAAYGSVWTDDVIWLPPDAPVLHSRQAILEYARPGFEEYTIDQEITIEEIRVADGFAVVRVNGEERNIPKTGEGEALEQSVKGAFLLDRTVDGSWVASRCIWNRNAPPAQ